MQTLLVTGAAGFAGSNFLRLAKSDPRTRDVKIIAHARSGGLEFEQGDLGHSGVVSRVIKTHKPDIIVHFAGRVPSAKHMPDQESFFHDNVKTVENLVLAAQSQTKKPHIIFPSTAGVYPLGGIRYDFKSAVREISYARAEDALPPEKLNSVYANSKLLAENALKTYVGPWTILRKSTVIGRDDRRGTFLQQLALHIFDETSVPERLLQKCADYISTKDLFAAVVESARETSARHQILNIGSGVATTGYEALAAMARAAKARGINISHVEHVDKSLPLIDYHGTILDIKKAHFLIGYKPQSTLDEMCGVVLDDAQENLSPKKYLRSICPTRPVASLA